MWTTEWWRMASGFPLAVLLEDTRAQIVVELSRSTIPAMSVYQYTCRPTTDVVPAAALRGLLRPAVGVVSEQVKTRLELASDARGTQARPLSPLQATSMATHKFVAGYRT